MAVGEWRSGRWRRAKGKRRIPVVTIVRERELQEAIDVQFSSLMVFNITKERGVLSSISQTTAKESYCSYLIGALGLKVSRVLPV